MRDIKFRGLHIKKRKWIYGDLIQINDLFTIFERGVNPFMDLNFPDPNIVDPETVGEFIGLKDSKRTKEFPEGQEIFEGDRYKDERGRIGVIKFEGCTFCYSSNANLYTPLGRGEVLGNIYEKEN